MRCRSNIRNFVAGTKDFIHFIFELSEDWNGLLVYAQFTQDNRSYNVYLDSDNMVALPPEISDGECTVALKGSGGNIVAITDAITICISPSSLVGGTASEGITLTLYEQLVNMINSGSGSGGGTSVGVIPDNSIEVVKIARSSIATNAEILSYLSS